MSTAIVKRVEAPVVSITLELSLDEAMAVFNVLRGDDSPRTTRLDNPAVYGVIGPLDSALREAEVSA